MNLNGFNEIRTPEAWKKNVIAKLDGCEARKAPRERNIRASRALRLLPVAAVIMATGITVTAIGLSSRDTVENIYFDRDYAHNLIMDMNPQYGTYLTEEGIEQLESFEPIALDVTDHSGNGNDLKSATLLGVMADKYTMTSLIEVEFNEDIVVPEDNIIKGTYYDSDSLRFYSAVIEDNNVRYGDIYAHTVTDWEKFEEFYEVNRDLQSANFKSPYFYINDITDSYTKITVAPVAEKKNTALIMLEDLRYYATFPVDKNSTVKYTLDEFGRINPEKDSWEPLVDGKYIFEIPTPKKLIPAEKVKADESFISRGVKFNIKSAELSQGYLTVDYTVEVLPEYYELYAVDLELRRSHDYVPFDIEIDQPQYEILNGDGRRILENTSRGTNASHWVSIYAGGEDYPPINPDEVVTALLHFEKPQNADSVKEIVFYGEDGTVRIALN